MYRLSQWAGDFPMLWEPHGSFTPLFTSQPEELAFSKSVSLRLHISASCPAFLFSVVFFLFCFFPSASRLNPGAGSAHCRSQLVLWQPCCDGHTDKILAYAGESSSSTPRLTVSRYRLTYCAVGVALMKRVLLTILAGSYCFLCSQRHPVSPFHN